MNSDPNDLISGYLDDMLDVEQQAELSKWIQSGPENAAAFARACLIHDRLHNTLQGLSESSYLLTTSTTNSCLLSYFRRTSLLSAAASIFFICIGLGWLWVNFGQSSATAAVRELNRIIVSNTRSKDRTYEVVVEEVSTPSPRVKQGPSRESQRPPKPPLDGAILHVRDNNQFVLIRMSEEGLPFVTGCNGKQSWAVNSKGPVRVSWDVNRFNRDLPGHETSIPLTNLQEGLERLKQAYSLHFSNLGPEEFDQSAGEETRMLVAVKNRQERGPQRVEISYDSNSGRIRHMRFIQMPYGPDRLDLRMKLVEERELPAHFFDHESHHALDRKVEMEN